MNYCLWGPTTWVWVTTYVANCGNSAACVRGCLSVCNVDKLVFGVRVITGDICFALVRGSDPPEWDKSPNVENFRLIVLRMRTWACHVNAMFSFLF